MWCKMNSGSCQLGFDWREGILWILPIEQLDFNTVEADITAILDMEGEFGYSINI